MLSSFLPWFLSLYSLCYLGLLIFVFRIKKRSEGRFPLGDDVRLMRQPGETLRLRVAELKNQFSDALLWIAGMPFVLALLPILAGRWVPQSWSWLWLTLSAAAFVAGVAWGLRRLLRPLLESRKIRLGLYGERVVADQLEELKSAGFRVFHDVPCLGGGGPFNLDHVVVGAGAVAVIETKTRRKHAPDGGGPDHRVGFDGKRLIWPGGSDTKSVDQVIRDAGWLQKRIKTELGIETTVAAVIAIPGWFVDQPKEKGPVSAVNAKMVPSTIRQECRGILAGDQIDQVSRHLAQMCRNVEFDEVA
jgi:hypothetical protein